MCYHSQRLSALAGQGHDAERDGRGTTDESTTLADPDDVEDATMDEAAKTDRTPVDHRGDGDPKPVGFA
ncbi:MAG: hypothetical protein ABEI27_05385 [Halobellus sp.]|uniref:hypothetical protein n=1 Tax=Halobellus sp. TaxID=1979212 RepID=UPI0035D4E71D